MKIRCLMNNVLLCLVIFVSTFVFGQLDPQLLSFNSSDKRELFLSSIDSTGTVEVVFENFMRTHQYYSSNDIDSFKIKLEELAKDISTNKKYIKKEAKRAEIIHHALQSTVLKKYILEAYPEQLVYGSFNCVTGTACTVYLAHILGLAYEIKEEPNHVYPVITIGDRKTPMETVDADLGYMKFPDAYKREAVEELKRYKLIGEDEYQGMSKEAIFDKLYEKKRNISFKDLMALQYSNQGIFSLQSKKEKEGVEYLAKAYYLMPTENQIKIGLASSISSYLYKDGFKSDYSITALKMLPFLVDTLFGAEILYQSYALYAESSLFKADSLVAFIDNSEYLMKNVSDSVIIMELNTIYSDNLSRYYFENGDFSKAAAFTEKVLDANPQNMLVLGNLVNCYQNMLITSNVSDSVFETFIGFTQKYPRLNDLFAYNNLVQSIHFDRLSQAITRKNLKGIRQQLQTLDVWFKKHPDLLKLSILADAYRASSLIFFEKNYNQEAVRTIDRAIALDPKNLSLKQIRKVFTY